VRIGSIKDSNQGIRQRVTHSLNSASWDVSDGKKPSLSRSAIPQLFFLSSILTARARGNKGIAAGIGRNGVRIGDVVVASSVYQESGTTIESEP
jgi:hypothetical protein